MFPRARLLACGLLWRRLARLGLGFRLADEVGGFPLGGTAASLAAPRLADLFAVRLRLRFQRRFRRRAFLARVDADIAEQQVETERVDAGGEMFGRSEEHTSELQSLMRISYAVFC